jgi:hypothetical protein
LGGPEDIDVSMDGVWMASDAAESCQRLTIDAARCPLRFESVSHVRGEVG